MVGYVKTNYGQIKQLVSMATTRAIKRLSIYLHQKYPEGIYKKELLPLVKYFYKKTSLHSCIEKKVKKALPIEQNEELEWFSELYQFISIIIGFTLLLIISLTNHRYNDWVKILILPLILYRPFEIFLFLTKWVFASDGKIITDRRSLAAFLVNFIEVIIYFSGAYLACGFYNTLNSLYSSLRIAVTIGPVEQKLNALSWLFPGLVMIQIVISYFLIVVVIASLAGAVKRGTKNN